MSVTKINTKQLGSNELVFTESNLLAGNNIEIAEVLPEGGIDTHTLACWHFDEDKLDVVGGKDWSANRAEITNAYAKFGGKSVYANGYAFSTGISASGLAGWTIDGWILFSTANTNNQFATGNYVSNYLSFTGLRADISQTRIKLGQYRGTIDQTFTFDTALSLYTWYHLAVQLKDGKFQAFINGKKVAEIDWNAAVTTNFGFYQQTYIDEVRISDVARYDADFTPPTKPYSLAIPTGKKQINFTGEIPDISSLATKEEINTVKNDLNSLGDQVSTIESKIPTDASDTNQLATKQQVDTLSTSVTTLENTITEIEAKIPDTATSENKLVTKSQMDEAIAGAGSGGSGTSDYSALTNKPQINSVELSGNKTLSDLGIQPAGSYATTAQLASKVDSSALSEVALTGSYTDLVDTPVIPEAYTLPAATSSTLGGVKVDGTTITVDDAGTISASGSASGFTCTFRDWTGTVTYQINPAITNNSSWSFDSTTGIITGNDSMSYLTVPSGWFTSGTTMVIAFTYATTSHYDGQQLLYGSGNDLDIYIGNNSSNLSSYGSLYSGTLFSLSTGVNYLLKLEHNSSSNTLTFSHSTDDGQAWNQDASKTTSINDSSFTLGRSSRPWAGTINLAKSYVLSSSGVYTYFAVPV